MEPNVCNCIVIRCHTLCHHNASGALGWYAVAIQVEDFVTPSSTVAMSSVPVQFLVLVEEIIIPPDLATPTFVGSTPADGVCIEVGSAYRQQITARSRGEGATYVGLNLIL